MVKTGYSAVSRVASLLGSCCKDVGMSVESSSVVVPAGDPPAGGDVGAAVPVESTPYFYGAISRETAEWVLWDRGCRDGMYLLRESSSDYVLSLCFQKSVLHYRIRRLGTGEVGLCGVPRQRFPGPVELVQGVEGLACRPTLPCCRAPPLSSLPPTHWGVGEDAVKKAALRKAREWGIDEAKLDTSLTENHSDLHLLITKTLHEIQPWFHGPLSRLDAERSIEESGHKDGKFLVRERDDSSYALCLSHSGRIKHYKIDVLPSGEFAIQDGQRFPSIMALVSHYTLFSDGLWCSLQDPCVVPPRRSSEISISRSRNSDDNRTNHQHHGGNSGTLERNKSSTLRNTSSSESASPPTSKTSRFLNSLNQRRLFSKIFSTVAQTLPQNAAHPGQSSDRRLYPSVSDDNIDGGDTARSVRARISPELIGHPPSTPPTCSRKSSFTSSDTTTNKKPGIQKASSFDFLPAFLSLFIYGEGTVTSRKSTPETAHRKMKRARNSENFSNGIHSLSRTVDKKLSHKPVPAPRLSLAKKTVNRSGPVYANREALSGTGRSISLGEDASMEEAVAAETLGPDRHRNGLPIPFARSASSPSVVTQSAASRSFHPASPRARLSTSEGSTTGDSATNGHHHLNFVAPVPKPRKRLPPPEGRTETSCDSCASVDSSTSPTLTEISEFGLESFSEDIFPSDIAETKDLSPDRELPAFTPELPARNETPPNDASHGANSLRDVFSPYDPAMGRIVAPGHSAADSDTSVYATLSGGGNVVCLMSSEAPSPPLTTTVVNGCAEGILVDIGISDLNTLSREESDLAYLTLRECRRGTLNLDQKVIDLKEKIGSGIFCDVFKGVFSSGPIEVQFAIKTLKSSSVPNPRSEILKEAQTMVALDHPHIVRLIGVSDSSTFMLVMELAPLGPLSKYLRAHREIPISEILVLLLQVASAMEYLESRQFVHRDLAARNVLLVNESFVKISDFGMSRALGLGKEYYRAESAGKWPLKWYAPECIYYFRFSHKSDVWSYGVTLWEALSYGGKPYQGMIGRDILRMFERNERLSKPELCPDSVYSVMRKCWQYKAEDRPSFSEIQELLRNCSHS